MWPSAKGYQASLLWEAWSGKQWGSPDKSWLRLEGPVAQLPQLPFSHPGHLRSLSRVFTSCSLSWRYSFTFSKSPTEAALWSFFKFLSRRVQPDWARRPTLAHLPTSRSEQEPRGSSFLLREVKSFFMAVPEAALPKRPGSPGTPHCPTYLWALSLRLADPSAGSSPTTLESKRPETRSGSQTGSAPKTRTRLAALLSCLATRRALAPSVAQIQIRPPRS